MISSKQEFGSFYEKTPLVFSESKWTDENTEFLGSGRDALYEIIRKTDSRSVTDRCNLTVWIPSYYCHPITNALVQEYDVRVYPSTPYKQLAVPNVFKPSDIIVVPEYFGNASRLELKGNPTVVLDKTHNPSSNYHYLFEVSYEFGSLRKILPIAEGGYLKYLSAYTQIPITQPPVTETHLENFRRVTSAMSTKSLYLQSKGAQKSEFLHIFSECESAFGDVKHPSGAVTPNKELRYLDMAHYLNARRQNNRLLASTLMDSSYDLELIDTDVFFIIGFKSNPEREQVKKELIDNNVYSAVLWPVDEQYMTEADKTFSQRILVLPTDFRYNESDILLLSAILKEALEGLNVVN